MKPQSVLILWSQVTSYFLASIIELTKQLGTDCETTVVINPSDDWYPDLLHKYNLHMDKFITYQDFEPKKYKNYELVLISSWNYKKYRTFARISRDACKVMAMDNQFNKTFKQIVFTKSVIGPLYVRYLMNFVFAAGSRQAVYATALGFHSDQIFTGVYSYDNHIFHPRAESRRENRFCFIGRKVSVKGVDLLIAAYQIYRSWCAEKRISAWELIIAGPGKVASTLPKGIQEFDYLDPVKTASLMSTSQCFVLPSNFEPFGVVLTEAAASGCLLIASSAVGAADDLIVEGVNGFAFDNNSPTNLATALLDITLLSRQEIEDGQNESLYRAQSFTPELWVRKLIGIFELHVKAKLH